MLLLKKMINLPQYYLLQMIFLETYLRDKSVFIAIIFSIRNKQRHIVDIGSVPGSGLVEDLAAGPEGARGVGETYLTRNFILHLMS